MWFFLFFPPFWVRGFELVFKTPSLRNLVGASDACFYMLPNISMDAGCRFRDFELVTQPPYLRSYVGAPVVLANGHRVGVM